VKTKEEFIHSLQHSNEDKENQLNSQQKQSKDTMKELTRQTEILRSENFQKVAETEAWKTNYDKLHGEVLVLLKSFQL
jgi:peptidoglycan hydrolase CwlO-like protein